MVLVLMRMRMGGAEDDGEYADVEDAVYHPDDDGGVDATVVVRK